MRTTKLIFCVLSMLNVCVAAQQVPSQTPTSDKRIVIATSALFDGKGRVLRNTRIVIEGARIVAIDPKAGPVDYDLRGFTRVAGMD